VDIIVFLLALPGAWMVLQTFSSFCYASENFLDEWLLKRLSAGNSIVEDEEVEEVKPVGILWLVSAFFGIVIAAVFGLVAFFAPDTSVTLNISKELIFQSLLIGMLEIVWLVPYLHATNHAGAVRAAPLFQSIPVIALVLGVVAHILATQFNVSGAGKFAELPPTTHIVAAGIIIAGGLLLDLTEVGGKWHVDKKTIGLMLFASAVIAFISFTFKDAALEGNFVATAFYSGIGMAISGALVFLFYAPYRKQFLSFCKEADKPTVLAQLGNEVVDTTAVMTSHAAVIIGPSVMAVSALNAWQPVFILIIGWVLAKRGSEAHADLLDPTKFKQTALAISLLAVGTVMIAL
jgi:hypothetical protein